MSPTDLLAPDEPGAGQVTSIWSFAALKSLPGVSLTARDAAAARMSGLFDEAHYCAGGPVLAPGEDPLLHYLRIGWREGRAPNLYFDPGWYIARNSGAVGGEEPLLHYLRVGEREGRRPVLFFDPVWYRETYDVPAGETCLGHFLARRSTGEVSPLPEFESGWYLRSYPDVARAGMDPMEHYLVQGFREARNPSPRFDSRFYRHRYLADAPGENPLLHYLVNRDRVALLTCRPTGETSIPREVRRNTAPGPCFEEIQPLPPGAAKRATVLAYYLPQFHRVPENDAWWGNGFTEWRNVGRALPRFAGHYQPRQPRDLGHYQLDGGETMRRQVELARGAGLSGFVFYFYWFDGHRLLERPLEAFLADRSIDFPFCLMWANENWTRQWDGSDEEVLIRQTYRESDEAGLVATFARHFADPRYIRLQGRPLLMIYRPGAIPDARERIARWRRLFRDGHRTDPIFVMAQVFGDHDPVVFGMDGAVEFPPHKLVEGVPLINDELQVLDEDFSAQVYAYDDLAARAGATPSGRFPRIQTVIPGWDNDARRQGAGLVVHGATPAKYQAWLEAAIRSARDAPFLGTPLVCVNAWNEWAEGAYLEPDAHFGAAFLNATGRAIAGLAQIGTIGRLLLVGHDAFPAGAQLLLLHLGRVLAARFGVRVSFLLLGGGDLLAQYESVGAVTVLADRTALPRVLAARRAEGVCTALVNTSAAAALCPILAQCGITATLLIHELPGLLGERALLAGAKDGAAAAAHLVFAAGYVRDRFLAATGLPAERTQILCQGVYQHLEFSLSARAALRERLGIAERAVLAIGVGYGDLRKGVDLFLQVLRATRRRGLAVHLAWAGDIDPVIGSYLGAEIEQAVATGRLHWLGWQEDVAALMSAADILLLTSREDPLPSVVLEAVSMGLPVIAFDGSGGVPDLLRRHEAGWTVGMADVDAMATRLARLAARMSGEPVAARRLPHAARLRDEYDFARYAAAVYGLAQPGLRQISVVVPSYNYARYLPARLASIFRQTYPVREVIVLDDASQDGSAEIARDVARQWRRDLQVIRREENSGTAFGRWREAAQLATGEYLWFAEADDASDPGFLDHLIAAIDRAGDAVIAWCDSRCVDADDQVIRETYRSYFAESAGPGALARDDIFQADGFARRFLVERNLVMSVSGVLFRRSALLAALESCGDELQNFRVAGDWRLYLELLAGRGGSVAYVASPLNIHRRHAASVTHRLEWSRHVREIAAMQKLAAGRLGIDPAARARQAAYLHDLRRQVPPPRATHGSRARRGPAAEAFPA